MGLNLKRQRFVNEYLIDGNATQAAARSGYSKATVKQQGSRLLSFVDVKSEIAAKKAEIARRSEVTLDSLSGMFIEDRARASELGQMSAAVSAVDKLARLHGFMVDRSVSLNLNQQMSDDELASIVRALQQQAAMPALEPRSDNLQITATSPALDTTPSDTPVKARAPKSLKRKANRKATR